MDIDQDKLVKRFLEYVKIDTQSDENSDTYPSTKKQLTLSNLLLKELREIGLSDVKISKHGYVFATLPSNLPQTHTKEVPSIGLIAHVDTSPDVSGKNVSPEIHRNYQGNEITLSKDSSQILKPTTDTALQSCIGHDIILVMEQHYLVLTTKRVLLK